MDVVIRLAEPTDASDLLQIYGPFVAESHTSFETQIPSIEEFSGRIQRVLEEAPWIVAELDGRIIGYAYAGQHRSRAAYQYNRELSVYLDQNHRGMGLGKVLYTILIEMLIWQGYSNVLAGVALPNPASQSFHRSIGFTEIGIYKDAGFKFDRFWSIQWWQKRIRDRPSGQIRPVSEMDNSTFALILEAAKTWLKA